MASVSMKPMTRVIRQLLSEVRKTSSQKTMKDSLVAQFVLAQSRKYQTTDLLLCRAAEEVKFTADLYLCYLTSMRRYNQINAEYTGKGERTVAETAKMVGFKLPHDPK